MGRLHNGNQIKRNRKCFDLSLAKIYCPEFFLLFHLLMRFECCSCIICDVGWRLKKCGKVVPIYGKERLPQTKGFRLSGFLTMIAKFIHSPDVRAGIKYSWYAYWNLQRRRGLIVERLIANDRYNERREFWFEILSRHYKAGIESRAHLRGWSFTLAIEAKRECKFHQCSTLCFWTR